MEDIILEIAEKTLKVSREELMSHYKELPEIDAYYFWNPVRGGLSVIVGKDGSRLGATSAVSLNQHIEAYKTGKRN